MRSKIERYPDYSAELKELRKNGVSEKTVERIIEKHALNRAYNVRLHERYEVLKEAVPIFGRQARYDKENQINNRVNHDFFGEIVDFKTGYFAGKPFAYGYSQTAEAEEETGGTVGVDEATKAVTDFVTRNNMYDVDMECTKNASISGYGGRLFYHDTDGNERVMPLKSYETIVLSDVGLSEPEYALRYFATKDINDKEIWTVEVYDGANIWYFEGQLNGLQLIDVKENLFDFCPLQIIVNNDEMQGDAEKVLSLIDEYDRAVSDIANDLEAFAQAYMVFKNIMIQPKEIEEAKNSGAFSFYDSTGNGDIYFLTKQINDSAVEHHLERAEDNIYRFSKTPNLADDAFGTASGEALKFKLTGLEAKCGMFQAKIQTANQYMFRLLASSWAKKKILVDPLQCTVSYKRNFPINLLSEGQTAQALIAAGLPKEVVFAQLSFIDDVDYVMGLLEAEKDGIPSLIEETPDDLAIDKTTLETSNLNGAQITALMGIVANYKNGTLSRSAAITVASSTLGIARETAEAIFEEQLSE